MMAPNEEVWRDQLSGLKAGLRVLASFAKTDEDRIGQRSGSGPVTADDIRGSGVLAAAEKLIERRGYPEQLYDVGVRIWRGSGRRADVISKESHAGTLPVCN
jgi:hypothetical protein